LHAVLQLSGAFGTPQMMYLFAWH